MRRVPNTIPATLTAVRVRQLQLFNLLAEVGSISEAARRLHVTQPTATEMLQELERAFSMQLFVRGSKGVSLTVQGERVAARVALILRELQFAASEGRTAKEGKRSLKVGMVPTLIYSGLRSALALLGATHPDIQIQLRELNVADSTSALRDGTLDVAFTLNHPSFSDESKGEPIRTVPLMASHLGVFASRRLKIRRDKRMDIAGLRELPWLLPTVESFTRRVFEEVFMQQGLSPPVSVMEISPMTLAVELLRSMPYVALLPKRMADEGDYPHLQPLNVPGFNFPARLVYACRESKFDDDAVQSLLQCVLKSTI